MTQPQPHQDRPASVVIQYPPRAFANAQQSPSVRRALTLIGVGLAAAGFSMGLMGGFYGNRGFPGGIRLAGALVVLGGAIVYVTARTLFAATASQAERLQRALAGYVAIIAVFLLVPFRLPSELADHPTRAISVHAKWIWQRYDLSSECAFGIPAAALVALLVSALAWLLVLNRSSSPADGVERIARAADPRA